jgi:UDP-glucose 6-dehydrogenase
VARNVAAGRLDFATATGPAVAAADVVLLAVGTPPHRGRSAAACVA